MKVSSRQKVRKGVTKRTRTFEEKKALNLKFYFKAMLHNRHFQLLYVHRLKFELKYFKINFYNLCGFLLSAQIQIRKLTFKI
ncbi:hypothetical protein BpHYR1_049482 [Brachionus plicatilis]|uniref:Uncharacterized protein n=1 Tax=Brachionus plicatilis TaxID=10195 RepID=A0A3M7RDT4_BRAPC|nr:hypothetical protein BpHYR1_049482 [Brachionus plicatilis]